MSDELPDQKTGTRPRLLERASPGKVLCICPRFSSRSPTMLVVYAPRAGVTMCIMIRTWHGSEVAALCISRVMSVDARAAFCKADCVPAEFGCRKTCQAFDVIERNIFLCNTGLCLCFNLSTAAASRKGRAHCLRAYRQYLLPDHHCPTRWQRRG